MAHSDEFYMRRALENARKAWGKTAPNPMVGAVLVRGGEIVAEGYHHADGMPHAERDCLKNAGEKARGCTMYVSLEPCSTHGRTGACCDAIAAAEVAEVVAGCQDPNPAHSGRAWAYLAERGVKSRWGVLEKECRELNFIFNKNITSSEALLAVKFAVSKDGKLTRRAGEHTAVSGAESNVDVMKWRSLFQSIGVGFGTLVSDNPRLTRRGGGAGESCGERLIFDASLNCAELDTSKYSVFADSFKNSTRIVCGAEASADRQNALEARGIRVMRIDAPSGSAEFWQKLKRALYAERICSLYIEGGARLFKSVCSARAADYVFRYESPDVFGCGLDAFDKKYFEIDAVEKTRLGRDEFTRGYPVWTHLR